MSYVFGVRSKRGLPSTCSRYLPCPLLAPPSPTILPYPRPHLVKHCICPPFVSAVRGVRPVAGLRHLQRQNHARHVLRALRAWSAPRYRRIPCISGIPDLAVFPCFDSRQGTPDFNQPVSFDTSSVTDMSWMFLVRSARSLPPIRPHPCISDILISLSLRLSAGRE